MPEHAGHGERERVLELDQVLGGGGEGVRRRRALRGAVHAQVDEHDAPIGARVDEAPREAAQVSPGAEEAMQREHPA